MEAVLEKILAKLDKLDKIEADVAAIKSNSKKIDEKIDTITNAVAQTMEDVTSIKNDVIEIKCKVDKQEVEIKVIKGSKAK